MIGERLYNATKTTAVDGKIRHVMCVQIVKTF